jgi:hypothetical protein
MSALSTFDTADWNIADDGSPSDSIWRITEDVTLPWLSFQGDAPDNVKVSNINTAQLIAEGFIPIANLDDLINISFTSPTTFAIGTPFETSATGGLNKNYILVNDIDINGNAWTPLGTFTGRLNGNNQTIKNFSISIVASGASGFFSELSGAEIFNLNLQTITGSGTSTGEVQFGFIAGKAGNSTLSGISIVSAQIDSTHNSGLNRRIGGMIGEATDNLFIIDSSFFGSINLNTGTASVGGLVGRVSKNKLSIINVSVESHITSEHTSAQIGGLLGIILDHNVIISNSIVSGSIINSSIGDTTSNSETNTVYIGGMIGQIRSNGEIRNSVSIVNITGPGSLGGLIGGALRSGVSPDKELLIIESINLGIIQNNSTAEPIRVGVGGLVGKLGTRAGGQDEIKLEIKNSYNKGSLLDVNTSSDLERRFGGIIGYVEKGNKLTMNNSYNVGIISKDTTFTGGLIGYIDDNGSPILESLFYDNETSLQSNYLRELEDIPDAIGKTTELMQQQNTFSGWDFDDIWTIEEGQSYPTLINTPEPE